MAQASEEAGEIEHRYILDEDPSAGVQFVPYEELQRLREEGTPDSGVFRRIQTEDDLARILELDKAAILDDDEEIDAEPILQTDYNFYFMRKGAKRNVPQIRSDEKLEWMHTLGKWDTILVVPDLESEELKFEKYTQEEFDAVTRAHGENIPKLDKKDHELVGNIILQYNRQMQGLDLLPIGEGGMADAYEGRRLGSMRFTHFEKVAKDGLEEALIGEGQLHLRVGDITGVTKAYGGATLIFPGGERIALLYTELVTDETEDGTPRPAETLAEYMGKATELEKLDVMIQVLDALGKVHDMGVVHRDIKPENILIKRKGAGVRAYVSDFGIAREYGFDRTTEPVNGTPDYMSPETLRGTDFVTAHDDLYAAGAVLYELLLGETPHSKAIAPYRKNLTEMSVKLITSMHKESHMERADGFARLAPEAKSIIEKSLKFNMNQRYQSAAEMAEDLRGLYNATFDRMAEEAFSRAGSTQCSNTTGMSSIGNVRPQAPMYSHTPRKCMYGMKAVIERESVKNRRNAA